MYIYIYMYIQMQVLIQYILCILITLQSPAPSFVSRSVLPETLSSSPKALVFAQGVASHIAAEESTYQDLSKYLSIWECLKRIILYIYNIYIYIYLSIYIYIYLCVCIQYSMSIFQLCLLSAYLNISKIFQVDLTLLDIHRLFSSAR